MKTIDLGRKHDHPEGMVEPSPPDEDKIHYPSLYVDSREGLESLPDEGEATIKYRVVSRTVSERDGKKTGSMELEIQSISPAASKKKSSKKSDLLDPIEDGLSKAEKNETEDDD